MRSKQPKQPHPLHVGAEPNIRCDLIEELKSFTSGIGVRKRRSARKPTPEPSEPCAAQDAIVDLNEPQHNEVHNAEYQEPGDDITPVTENKSTMNDSCSSDVEQEQKDYEQEKYDNNESSEAKNITDVTIAIDQPNCSQMETEKCHNEPEKYEEVKKSAPFESIVDRIKHSLESPTRKTIERHEDYVSEVCDENILGASLEPPAISSTDTINLSEVNVFSNTENMYHNVLGDAVMKTQEDVSSSHSTKDIEVVHIRSVAPIARVSPSPMPIPVQEVQPLGASALPLASPATSTIPGPTRRRSSNGDSPRTNSNVDRGNDIRIASPNMSELRQSPSDILSLSR